MSARTDPRGRPLLVLATILGGWLVGRVLFWHPLFPHPSDFPYQNPQAGDAALVAVAAESAESIGDREDGEWTRPAARSLAGSLDLAGSPPATRGRPVGSPGLANIPHRGGDPDYSPARRAAGHQMLLAAAFSHRDLATLGADTTAGGREPAGLAATSRATLVVDRPLLVAPGAPDEARPPRFSGDAWLLWRDGSAVAVTPGVSTYGRSQAGAVIRYRLLPGHPLDPAAYARVTRTLAGSRQSEAAAGLSIRPLSRLPVIVAAEARVTETAAGREVRPAGFAVTQLPPIALPLGLRGEAYLQGGYVGGDFETAFVDGQARVDRKFMQVGNEQELRVGLGAWGGAQKGAARLDAGPSASLDLKLGDARSRIAVDYRLRLAGDAEPASGPAVTFSAGF